MLCGNKPLCLLDGFFRECVEDGGTFERSTNGGGDIVRDGSGSLLALSRGLDFDFFSLRGDSGSSSSSIPGTVGSRERRVGMDDGDGGDEEGFRVARGGDDAGEGEPLEWGMSSVCRRNPKCFVKPRA